MKVANGKAVMEKLDNQRKQPTLQQWVMKMTNQIKNALPANITPERMTRIALTALSKDTKLAQTTPESFLGALLTSAQLGLECNTPLGQAYLIPYNNKGRLEAQFQLGYQGLLDLCYRTGQYKKITARVVYEGDVFEYSYGLDEKLIHIPNEKSDKPIYVYAMYQLINGASSFEVMGWEAILRHSKKYSQAVKSGMSSPWDSDTESMAKKTVLKRVLKYAPKTVENAELVAEAVNSDSAIIKTNVVREGNDYIITKDFDFSPVAPEQKTQTPPKEQKAPQPQPKYEPTEEELNEEALNAAFEAQAEQYEKNAAYALF